MLGWINLKIWYSFLYIIFLLVGITAFIYSIIKLLSKRTTSSTTSSSSPIDLTPSSSDFSSLGNIGDILSDILSSSDDTICEPTTSSCSTIATNNSLEIVHSNGKVFLVVDKKTLKNTISRINDLTNSMNKNILNNNSSSMNKFNSSRYKKKYKVNINTFNKTLIKGKNVKDIIENNII